MNPRDQIRYEAATLSNGCTVRVVCPFCRGGSTGERTMNITRTADGALYNCHRSSCASSTGFVGGPSGHVVGVREKAPDFYTGETLPLRLQDKQFFEQRYDICGAEHWIHRTGEDEYLLPIFAPDGSISGYNVRQPWPDAPCKGRSNRPKSRVYAESRRPVQSFYGFRHPGRPLLLVEDQLSALRASQSPAAIGQAVALMGTYLDIPRVQELARQKPCEVLLALDKDATETAFKLAREYGLAFPRMRVVILDKDIKDTPSNEINEILGL